MKRRLILGITGAMLAVVAFSGSVMAAAPATAPTTKYVWDDETFPYAGPAAMLVNNAGAIVWWHIPNETTWYKDVYRFHDFEGAAHWGPVSTLNAPVNTLMVKHFPTDPDMFYTREVTDVVPKLGQPTRIYTLRDHRTMTVEESDRFYAATETISSGFIVADPYAPAINVTATGVVGDTAHVGYIESGQWRSLGPVEVVNGAIDATLLLEPNTTYSGYFAINNGTQGTQFIAGPLNFTTAKS